MSRKYVRIWFCLLFLCTMATIYAINWRRTPDNAKHYEHTDQELSLITRLNYRVLAANHFRKYPADHNFAAKVIDSYFKMLDFQKMFFTAVQVRDYHRRYDNRLVNDLLSGDNTMAFEIYRDFLTGYNAYTAFAENRLKKPFDFNGRDEIDVDRSKCPWPADENARLNYWELYLKELMLAQRLRDRILDVELKKEKVAEKGKPESADKDKAVKLKEEFEDQKLWQPKNASDKILRRMRDFSNVVKSRSKMEILNIFINSMCAVFGNHSNYTMPVNQEENLNMGLSFTGIGATLTLDAGYVKIVELIPGGPAAKSGKLKVNDRLIGVREADGKTVDLIDMPLDKVVQHVRGPKGSKVTLTILPGALGRFAKPVNVVITRDVIKVKESVVRGEVHEVNSGTRNVKIGVVKFPGFYLDMAAARRGDDDVRRCSQDLSRLLKEFNQKKVEAVVIDMRNNFGGSLVESIVSAGLFIESGPVVQVRTSNGKVHQESDRDSSCLCRQPVVILCNKLSASASEIFAGALRDYHRAVLVGDGRTFGKGTILNVIPLDEALGLLDRKFPVGMITFETGLFYRVNGSSPQQLGVKTDIQLPAFTRELKVGEMYENNHLPWDSVTPLDVKDYNPDFEREVAILRNASQKRVAADPEFSGLEKKLQILRKHQERKKVSLNEKIRYSESLAENELLEALDRKNNIIHSAKSSDKNQDNDIQLREAMRIAADWTELRNNGKISAE